MVEMATVTMGEYTRKTKRWCKKVTERRNVTGERTDSAVSSEFVERFVEESYSEEEECTRLDNTLQCGEATNERIGDGYAKIIRSFFGKVLSNLLRVLLWGLLASWLSPLNAGVY